MQLTRTRQVPISIANFSSQNNIPSDEKPLKTVPPEMHHNMTKAPQAEKPKENRKGPSATAKAGYKLKIRKNEELVAFRPSGHTAVVGKTKNFNYNLQRTNYEGNKNKLIGFALALSLIPIAMFIGNAESNFRNAQVKQIAEKRRKRLDEEHDVDRELL